MSRPGRETADSEATELKPVFERSLETDLGQLRAAPVRLGGGERAILLVHSADAEVDPYAEMFFFPSDTLTMTLLSADGAVRWERDLGPGVVPGIWFCPVFPFDLDGDGVTEVWFVDNVDEEHPLALSSYRLARLDPESGEVTGRWAWPDVPSQRQSRRYRNFVLGGHADGEPVLVTAQGTYGPMRLQGWNQDMTRRWEHEIADDDPGARGSHMCPVVDVDDDGVDEVLWGERAIGLDDGEELFCADRDSWDGHSDVIQPTIAESGDGWRIFTTRESDWDRSPRVATYDEAGERLWGDVDDGHVDMGWTARVGDDGSHVAMAIRIDGKSAGKSGFGREGVTEFAFDVETGERVSLPFSTYGTLPVDLDGDGVHELVYGGPRMSDGDGDVISNAGAPLGTVGGTVAMASKFLDRPGEQVLSFTPEGTVTVWADANASDGEAARARYEHPYYEKAQRLSAVGYNWVNLGGL